MTKAKEPKDSKYQLPKPKFPKLELPKSGESTKPVPDCEGQYYFRPTEKGDAGRPKPPTGKKRILIGIPILAITFEFFDSFLKFWTELCVQNDSRYEIGYHFCYRRPVHMAEEYLVDVALYNHCTHILFMDDDIYDVTKADLDKLIEADKDVIGGVMHASKFPHAMCVFRRFNPKKKVIDMPSDNVLYRLYEVPCLCTNCNLQLSHWDLPHCPSCGAKQDNLIQQADLIPFAFTLMKTSIFAKLKQPWFHCTNKYPTDSWFADRLKEAKLTEHAHMGVRLNHAGITDASKPFYSQMGMQAAQESQRVVGITSEEMGKHQFLLHEKMMEAEQRLKAKPAFVADGKATQDLSKRDKTLKTHGK